MESKGDDHKREDAGNCDGVDANDTTVIDVDGDKDPAWNEWRQKRGPLLGREEEGTWAECHGDTAIFDADLSIGFCALLPELGEILGFGGIAVREGERKKSEGGRKDESGDRASVAMGMMRKPATIPIGT